MGPGPADWVPPSRFDEYRLVRALGQGSMGQVWVAHDTVLDRLVAVKFISEHAAHEAARERFVTEARAAARVQHPNIIVVYRVGEIGARPYLISEYVRGTSLDRLARPVAAPRLLEIACGLARGLAAAHGAGVLHRDLKPANAILSDTGEVKLLDFGLAKLLPLAAQPARRVTVDVPGQPDPELAPRATTAAVGLDLQTIEVPAAAPAGASGFALPDVTHAGTVIGTPAYMAPEAWRGEPATPRSDVYSLGALLYALAAGAPPPRGDRPDVTQDAAPGSDPRALARAAPGIDAAFAAVVDRCLRSDPAARFASGDAVRVALEALVTGGTSEPTAAARPPRVRAPRRIPPAVVVGGALVVLGAWLVVRVARGPHEGRLTPAPHTLEARQVAGLGAAGGASGHCPADMVPVPGGTFQMGSSEPAGPDDQTPHDVTLSAYCIDRTEVTVAAYAACVAASACRAPTLTVNWPNYSANDRTFFNSLCNRADHPDHPINCVDWDQAVSYCAWQGKRLPTEAEWEYAAGGSGGRRYPWGQEPPNPTRVNARGSECVQMPEHSVLPDDKMYGGNDGWRITAPVGSYPAGASPVGALDMAGNVWEWTADWYGLYPARAERDPQGPRTGTSRVCRGGSWATVDVYKVGVTWRGRNTPSVRDCDLGFRCARGR